jgi:hypothetical protein
VFDKGAAVGHSENLGWFAAGTDLIFRLDVHDTGLSYLTGDASRNPDGIAHALATTIFEDDAYLTTVGFEDLYGGGDRDFDDFEFQLSNVVDPLVVPSPGVIALHGIGFIGFSVQRKLRRRPGDAHQR